MKKYFASILLSGLFLVSCSSDDNAGGPMTPEEPEPVTYTSGSADFSNYVAVGNSLTAGYSDAALFIDGQNASFPNMLATNFALAGGGAFNIPYMADNLGGATLGGQAILGNRLILSFASGSPIPTPVSGTGTTEISNTLSGTFNNMGVPGAKSYHLAAPGYGNVAGVPAGLANPYYARFASSATSTIIGDAVAQNPSFFTLWAGGQDLIGYASAGGDGIDQTGNLNPATYAGNDITDPNVFAGAYNGLLQALTANGADGAIANIPDIISLPYFTRVPFAPLEPTNPDFGPQIPTLNANFGQLNLVFAFLGVPERSIVFSETSASALLIKDENLADISAQITAALISFNVDPGTATVTGLLYGQARQANEDDLIVFPSQLIIGELNEDAFAMLQGLGVAPADAGLLSINGITYPLEDRWVLTPEEQQSINVATEAYNQTIAALATQYDLTFVDINAYFDIIFIEGVQLGDGSTATADYGTGGVFSLDGIHPSPRGYALVANQFIEAINARYGSNLPGVNPLDFTGLYIK